MKKTIFIIGMFVLVLAVLSACAPGPNPQVDTPNKEGEPAGFWLGLWHGLITPITFVISLFNDNLQFYEVANNGNWYDFGYILGIIVSFGGSGGGAGRGSRRS